MGGKGGIFRDADGIDKLLLFLGTLGSIGDGLMSPLTMLILSGVINEYGTMDATFSNKIVDKYALKLLYLALGIGTSAFIEGFCWTRTAERQTSRIRIEYLRSILRQEVGFLDGQDASSTTFQVVSTISTDAHSIQDAIADKIPNLLAHMSAFIISLAVAFMLCWRLALAAFPLSLMFVVLGLGFGKIIMKLGMKMKESYGVAGGIAEQAISSIRTVYSFVGERQTIERFSNELNTTLKFGIKQGLTKGLLMGSMAMVFVAWAFEAWVGGILVTEKGEKGGPVFISGVCIVMGGLSILSALPNLSFISDAIAAGNRINQMIDHVPLIDSEANKGKILSNVRGEILFKEVDFSYPSRPEKPVLQGFNLKIQAGKTVGLVGGSGSGKSTIISLLERFYNPVSGDIYLDKCKLRKLQVKWLRSQMGLVNQEPILFATSIKENILFGKEGASMELVIDAAKAANAHDFIAKLPDGYETQVGQFGVQLSGGQKQRIAIARALIRDPKILLLDEATSALDAESERTVQEALDQASQGRTTIIVAHRLSTIRKADLIVVLQSGKVVESGSHDELVQMNNGEGGFYKKMVELQQTASENETSPCTPNHLEKRDQHRTIGTSTPSHVTRSWQGSPASMYSPIYSISIRSFDPYDDSSSEDIRNHSGSTSSQLRLLRMNAPEWKNALAGCLGAATSGSVQPLNAYCLGKVVSIYFLADPSSIRSQTKLYCFIFLLLALISFISNIFQHYNFAAMGESLTKRVREKLLGKVLTFEVGWFDQDDNTSAAICARLASEASIVRSLVADRLSLLVQVFFSASLAFILGLVVTWRVAIVMIAMQPFVIGCLYSRTVLMKSMSRKAQKAQNEGSQLASEATINHRTITAFSSQSRILNLFRATLEGPRKENIKQSWFSGIGLFISQFLTTSSIALTYWYGGRLVSQGHLKQEHLFEVFFILMSTGKNIADAGSMTSDIAKGGSAIRSVFEILNRETEIDPDDPEGISIKRTIRGQIELKNIFFAYPARPDQMIFRGLSLNIEAGKRIALVGQSGSGKSTIIGLIERFYDPLKGIVLIDDRDIKTYNLRTLRSHIALVSQEPTLFAGTIRENILYGSEGATEADIRKAAVLANANEFISSLKDGYYTYCGERGVQLSGGQKQRIALARAILKNPTVLLLDEATSALDSMSENLVQEALEKMMVGRTCVVVAHRLSTIQNSDTIAVIKDGKVVEQGSHRDLLALGNRGAYYSLIKLQESHSP